MKDHTVILHMSDLHFCDREKSKNAATHSKVMTNFINNHQEMIKRFPEWSPDLLVITGDIAQSGTKKDFDEAKLFFEKLLLLPENKIKKKDVIVCFGNHDVDTNSIQFFPGQKNSYEDIDIKIKIDSQIFRPPKNEPLVEKHKLTCDKVAKYKHRFKNAEAFCSEMGFTPFETFSGRKINKYKYSYGFRQIKNINFVCLNTEWNFWGKNDKDQIAKGHLQIGVDIYQEAVQVLHNNEADFKPFEGTTQPSIVIFHRNYDYLHISEQVVEDLKSTDRNLGNLLRDHDIILNGHSHVSAVNELGMQTQIIAGASFDDKTLNDNAEPKELKNLCCNLIAIPNRLKPDEDNVCLVRTMKYLPNSIRSSWRLDDDTQEKNFKIERISDTTSVKKCFEIIYDFNTTSNESKKKELANEFLENYKLLNKKLLKLLLHKFVKFNEFHNEVKHWWKYALERKDPTGYGTSETGSGRGKPTEFKGLKESHEKTKNIE